MSKREQDIGARLEQVAGLSAQDAKAELITKLESEARDEAAALVRNITEQAKKNADREAKKIVALAIQRIAAEQTAESSVSAVVLPSDEMKGRIIGREGRNIRAFEAATGVDVIIDDTPDTVVVSGGADGPDTWAEEEARRAGLDVRVFRPDLAGVRNRGEATRRYYARNQQIVDASDELAALVSPDRKGGTEDTIRRAKKRGIPVTLL